MRVGCAMGRVLFMPVVAREFQQAHVIALAIHWMRLEFVVEDVRQMRMVMVFVTMLMLVSVHWICAECATAQVLFTPADAQAFLLEIVIATGTNLMPLEFAVVLARQIPIKTGFVTLKMPA